MKKLLLLIVTILCGINSFGQIKGSEAFIASQDFVKEKLTYPEEVDFNSDYVFEKDGYDKYIILSKFVTKNTYGVKIEYAYKIWLEHNGKDWSDKKNWTYSKMILENASTRKQQIYGRRR